jgi:UDP-GlcNAc:undecaprenyl-phosphate/decaprenyl-phosphate GlcNAc-1-phosphate transferase
MPSVTDAIWAFLVAAAVTAAVTPLTARVALRLGAVDEPRDRGLSDKATPLLGGLAILAGVVVAGLLWLPAPHALAHGGLGPDWHWVLAAAGVIAFVGAVDDRFNLPPGAKLAGQIAAAVIAVHFGRIVVHNITLPFIGALQFPNTGPTLTAIGLIALMNIVNFSDGVDGLAAGVCAIVAVALAVVAFDLQKNSAGVLAALTAGAALGFLFHNFYPASSFMGDAGSNLLGLLMGCMVVEGSVKKPVVISFVLPLILLTVPFLDTTFVLLKRIKYRQPVYRPDSEHFHHRLARIGFSQRRTVLLFYGWTLMLAGLALAMRFIPYSDHHGHLRLGWSLVLGAIGLIVAAASVYLIYVLEILKFRRLATIRLRRMRPEASVAEIQSSVEEKLETGEFDAVLPTPAHDRDGAPSKRQVARARPGSPPA